ncbi:MAG: Gfo/Idh/MocA family oxidoreductase [Planctomycetota bacterium]
MASNDPVRYAMVGGGLDAFIGGVHRRAAALDGEFLLVAGALSKDADVAKESGAAYGVASDRAYLSIDELIAGELVRDAGERAELVSIVTPNFLHFEQAKACLEAGFHVLVEKPMTMTSGEARELEALARDRSLACVVMYTYTGYPMVREARARCLAGELGTVRKVFVEYHQGWLSAKVENEGVQQAEWRTDPKRAGIGGALGDIGSHAENLVSFITGLEIDSLSVDLTSFVDGRALDDDAAVLLRFRGGAKGVLTASQICAGEGNGLSIRVYGDKGGLRWRQETPEFLEVLSLDGPTREIVRGGPRNGDAATAGSRIPVGHPEGFIEAFGNIYRGAAELVRARREGREAEGLGLLTPGAAEGRRGLRFIELCVESSANGSAWTAWSDD